MRMSSPCRRPGTGPRCLRPPHFQTGAVPSGWIEVASDSLRRAHAAVLGCLVALLFAAAPAAAQSLHDGILLPGRALGTGVVFAHQSWTEYWEGTLKRDNENIGTLTTRSATLMGAYGLTDRLSLLAMLPFVQTQASEGTLRGMQGFQDLTVGAKYRLLTVPATERATLSIFAAGAVGVPVGDYSPDFLPLSIGLGSRRASSRLTLHFEARDGWFLDASSAYTWRGKVKLDRSAYYTDGRLYLTDEVAMPAVFDYMVSAGYRKGRLHVPLFLTEQRTLGGGDIRRQDMPFVSNRMNFVEVGAGIGYLLPADFILQLGAGQVVSGRNVGQSTTFSVGLQYMHPF